MPVDVRTLDPDFLIFPTYKWVLGPYGRAFLYVAKRHQDGVPLEQTSYGRRSIAAERVPYLADTAFIQGAGRFDMGERDHFVSLEMAAIGMELVAEWGAPALAERIGALNRRIAAGLKDSPARVPEERFRAPHILSVAFPDGLPPSLAERLAAVQIYVAPRLGRLRISPHAYNDEEDADRFVEAMCKLME